MDTLLPHIQNWFSPKKEHFLAFSNADTRIEGWFKAELLVLLNRLKNKGYLDEFKREINLTSPIDGRRKQVDFQFSLQSNKHLCEIKALCISQAAGTPRNLGFYFGDNHLGLVKDFLFIELFIISKNRAENKLIRKENDDNNKRHQDQVLFFLLKLHILSIYVFVIY